jgi:phosphoserine aminotransferase
MANKRVYNFSAGPAMLPLEVLTRAGDEITNYKDSGMSVMEMSHRSKIYLSIFDDVMARFRKLGNIPENYKVLFLQGGATTQFAAVPLNLISSTGKADYAVTGQFSKKAADEAKKYGEVQIAYSTADKNHTYIPAQADLKLDPALLIFTTAATTPSTVRSGTTSRYREGDPGVRHVFQHVLPPLRRDKVRRDLCRRPEEPGARRPDDRDRPRGPGRSRPPLYAVMLDYAALIKGDSMHNTPPCYNIYILGLVLEWIESLGGLEGIAKRNAEKAAVVYDAIDSSRLFHALAEPAARSRMNVTFRTESDEMDAKFIAEATAAGLLNVKGYRTVGGMRASIYNAMPVEGTAAWPGSSGPLIRTTEER